MSRPWYHSIPRRTCGPEPTTRSAPASITACANDSGSPRFSPRNHSVPGRTCCRSEPSAPACIDDDDEVSLCFARRTILCAAGRSVRLCAHG